MGAEGATAAAGAGMADIGALTGWGCGVAGATAPVVGAGGGMIAGIGIVVIMPLGM